MMLKKSRSITNIGVAHFVTITYNNEDLNYFCDLFFLYAQLNFSCFFLRNLNDFRVPLKQDSMGLCEL